MKCLCRSSKGLHSVKHLCKILRGGSCGSSGDGDNGGGTTNVFRGSVTLFYGTNLITKGWMRILLWKSVIHTLC